MKPRRCMCAAGKPEPGRRRRQSLKLRRNYNRIINNEITAPLIGLKLSYDEASSILTVEPTPYFTELYENKIMSDVALKQSEESRGRYSKFIETVE